MRATFGAGPLVIAHRGASGYRPEHSRLAYDLAIDQDADFIEADLVMTRDGAPVLVHQNDGMLRRRGIGLSFPPQPVGRQEGEPDRQMPTA